MDKFTYIISSLDDVNGHTDRDDNCNIRINSLPTQYNSFKVKVCSFIINTGSLDNTFKASSYIHLVADNFVSQNQLISGNRIPNVLAFVNASGDGQITNVNNTFILKNINGYVVNFRLLDDEFNGVNTSINENGANTAWTLILEFEGLTE